MCREEAASIKEQPLFNFREGVILILSSDYGQNQQEIK